MARLEMEGTEIPMRFQPENSYVKTMLGKISKAALDRVWQKIISVELEWCRFEF